MKKLSSFSLFLVSLFILVVFCVFSYYVLDPAFLKLLKSNYKGLSATRSFPDFLLLWVVLSSMAAWLFYFFYRRKKWGQFCFWYGILIPVSYVLKIFLKFIFGRPNPRDTLVYPHFYGFHWFTLGNQYSAFPSGHMIVFSSGIFLFTLFYPAFRSLGYLCLIILAMLLVWSRYHFLSDVVAGTFVGYWTVRFILEKTYKKYARQRLYADRI